MYLEDKNQSVFPIREITTFLFGITYFLFILSIIFFHVKM